MASGMKPLLFVFALSWFLSMQQHSSSVHGTPQVPCLFIFGDSLADNGNNNQLQTLAKVNYKPYGIDFPGGKATGRFANGRTTVDYLSEILGFDNYIPPFANLNGSDILNGVNYASGSAGIRKETGTNLGPNISMRKQLDNHRITILQIVDKFGKQRRLLAHKHLNKCLYHVNIGSNDYINNYFLPQFYYTSKKYTTEQFAEVLIGQYTGQIMLLYKYGARKMVLVGLGRIGCAPFMMSSFGTKGCVDKLNDVAKQFNNRLVTLVDQLNRNYTDAKFIYINSYEMGDGDPAVAGFTVSNRGCCVLNEVGQCSLDEIPCKNRTEYVFWDGFHPTEAVNKITALRQYSGYDNKDSYPMDINHLVKLQLNPNAALWPLATKK